MLTPFELAAVAWAGIALSIIGIFMGITVLMLLLERAFDAFFYKPEWPKFDGFKQIHKRGSK